MLQLAQMPKASTTTKQRSQNRLETLDEATARPGPRWEASATAAGTFRGSGKSAKTAEGSEDTALTKPIRTREHLVQIDWPRTIASYLWQHLVWLKAGQNRMNFRKVAPNQSLPAQWLEAASE